MTDYDRLVTLTRMLWNVAEILRLKGRTEAADVVHDECVHFSIERDIARAMADAELDLDAGISQDLGLLPDD